MKIKIALVCICIAFNSCINNERKNYSFQVEINAVVKKDNMLIVYFKDRSNQLFVADRTVWLGVKENQTPQDYKLVLPKGVLPRDIRLNYCFDKLNGPLQINSITLRFNKSAFKIKKENFLEYFKPNQYVNYDEKTGLATPISINGKSDPFFLSREKLLLLLIDINQEDI